MPMRLGTERPSLEGATEWMNTTREPRLAAGEVTLVHFWAVSCHICHETMPALLAMRDKYQPLGLKVIAVHFPRIDADANVEKVRADIEEYGITQPVAIDHRRQITDRFQNEYVPAFFIFGKDGDLTFRAAGDKGFEKVEGKIREAMGLQQET